MARFINSIKVSDLIAALQDEDQDAMIVFVSDYGDIGHTQQAHVIEGNIESVMLAESGYSVSGWAVSEPDENDEEDENEQSILMIK